MPETLFDFDASPVLRVPIGEHAPRRRVTRARRDAPDTAHEAASSIPNEAASALELEILEVLRAHGPLSDEQISTHLPKRHAPTVWTARSRLYRRHLVRPCDFRRRSSRGSSVLVWELAR